jgi:hypothetical protein
MNKEIKEEIDTRKGTELFFGKKKCCPISQRRTSQGFPYSFDIEREFTHEQHYRLSLRI